jgi:PleD family two-component response regulator
VPDLVIQDIRLPDIDGYEVVRELRSNLRTSKVPIIFLTDRKARNDKITGLKLGAVDYLTKPFDIQELRLRVRNALRRAGFASLVSPVTGLPGREVVEDRLQNLLSEAHWAVLYVTIPHMGSFGDNYGFVASDDVLRAVSLILSNVVDEIGNLNDFVGHIERSDFLLVTHESKAQDMRNRLAARLERAFHYFYSMRSVGTARLPTPIRGEIGIVTASSGPYDSGASILRAAMNACQVVAESQLTPAV